MLKVYFIEDWAFTRGPNRTLICFGEKKHVEQATEEQIGRMILEAVAVDKYHDILVTQKRICH